MGEVISATVLYDNGEMQPLQQFSQIDMVSEQGRIEFEYLYGPQLIPPAIASDDGMWRYKALLPLLDVERMYPLAVGATPLIAPARLRQQTGLAGLWIKDETRSPTGSNKDRATALILERALHAGVHTISCASTGNVAVSLAFGAAAAGLQAVIFVPTSVSDTKLRLMLLSGATVFKVEEGYEAAIKLSRIAARAFHWYDRNTGYNPLTLEAKKTVAFEIWEQLKRQTPDVILVPVGDGVTLNGIAKGFRELIKCGVANRLPRLVGVQAEGCQPLKMSWEHNKPAQILNPMTIADGIAVTAPINATMALRDVRDSQGSFIAVSDEAMLNAISTLLRKGGILAEPAGAAALAGVDVAMKSGLIKPHETVIVLVTGTGMKNLPSLQQIHTHSAHHIHADLQAVEQVLQQSSN